MKQLFKDQEEEKKQDSSLQDAFNAIKNKVKEAPQEVIADKVVTLHTGSPCGCDNNVYILERTVPGDSTLQNGDWVTELFDTDKIVGKV